jgi:hypothetical protein
MRQRRLVDRERDVGLAHGDDRLLGARALLGDDRHRPARQLIEAARDDLLQDLLLAAEMAVGRSGGDAGETARVGEREVLRPALHDELAGGGNQRLAQVAVMIGRLAHHLARLLCGRANFTFLHTPQHGRFTRN